MVSQMEKLRAEIRKVVSKHMKAHGGALLAEGRKPRHPSLAPRKASKKAPKKHHLTHHMSGHALLAEGRKASRKHSVKKHLTRHMSGHAMLAEGRKATKKHSVKKHSVKKHMAKGLKALQQINHIATILKKKDPYLDHKTAISHASKIYRDEQ